MGCATHKSGASAGVAGPSRNNQVSLSMWPLPTVSMGFFWLFPEWVFYELWEEEPKMAYLLGVIDGGSH